MGNIIKIFFACILLVSCSSKSTESDSSELNKDSVTKGIDESKIEEEIDTFLIKAREEQKIKMTKKSYTFKCTKDCSNSGEPPEAYSDTVKKYGIKKPYRITKSKNNSIYAVQFRFIDDCCQEFGGDMDIVSNDLRLTYKVLGGAICDCDCVYEYRFEINLKNRKIKKVYLNGKKI
jgi:hypothetical protein